MLFQINLSRFAKTVRTMKENKNILKEGAVPYSQTLAIKDIPARQIRNAKEYLKGLGCLSQEEFDSHYAKFL